MVRFWKSVKLTLLALALSAGSALAELDQEQATREPNGSEEFVDTIIGRPLGLLALGLGAISWVVALPFSLPSHSTGSATKGLVTAPAKWTFRRPLGRFVSCDEQPDICK